MSVRDKIAGFGGAGSTSTQSVSKLRNGFASSVRVGTSVPMSSSNSITSSGHSAFTGDTVRKLKVPDAFRKNAPAAEAPAISASSSRNSPPTVANKWGAKPRAKSGSPNDANAVAGTTGVSSVGSSAGNGAAPRRSAPVQDSANGATAHTAMRDAADAKKPGDVSQSGSSTNGTSASSSSRTPAAYSEAAAVGGGGSGGGNDRGLASPRSRPGKPKAGPRKLNLTRISAEKQRAALGLDKKEKTESSGAGQQQEALFAATTNGVKQATGSGGGSGSDRAAPPSTSYTKPAPASGSASQGRFNGGPARAREGGIPSAGSLRSSGHKLW